MKHKKNSSSENLVCQIFIQNWPNDTFKLLFLWSNAVLHGFMVSRKYLCSRFSFLTGARAGGRGGGGWATTNTLDTCRISLFDPLRSQGYFSDIDDDDDGDYYKKAIVKLIPDIITSRY